MRTALELSRLRQLSPAWRAGVLAAACAAAVAAVLAIPPNQLEWPGPRGLADRRTFLGIPNTLDVLSNLPFALAGLFGFSRLRALERGLQPLAIALYAALIAVALGSGLYHVAPSRSFLLADRLPITVAFMSALALVVGDRISPRLARAALGPLVAAGIGTAFLWYLGGDPRPYALVQAVPLAALPALLFLFAGRLDGRRLFAAFVLYGVAKLFELLDHQIFALGGLVSGHALKHLAAGAACFFLLPVSVARVQRDAVPEPAQASEIASAPSATKKTSTPAHPPRP